MSSEGSPDFIKLTQEGAKAILIGVTVATLSCIVLGVIGWLLQLDTATIYPVLVPAWLTITGAISAFYWKLYFQPKLIQGDAD